MSSAPHQKGTESSVMKNRTGMPNIVVIMADQLRADATAREGFALDTMPSADSMARNNLWFDKAYTSCPMCVPARISMMTGRYPSAHRVCGHVSPVPTRDEVLFSKDLLDVAKECGYTTALFGKNHSHVAPDVFDVSMAFSHSGQHGGARTEDEAAFDAYLRTLAGHVGMEPAPFPLQCQQPVRITSKATAWIDERKCAPFLLWLSYPEPHNPFQVPRPYFDMFPPGQLPEPVSPAGQIESMGFKWQLIEKIGKHVFADYGTLIPRIRSNYYGMMRLIDDQLKRFMGHLELRGLLEDTLVVFLSDHGDFAGDFGLIRKGAELPDALARIPMVFAGWDVRPAGLSNCHVSIVDIMPTLVEAMGAEIPEGVQGRSLLPVLRGEDFPASEFESVYMENGTGGLSFTEDNDIVIGDRRTTWDYPDGKTDYDDLNMYSSSGALRGVRKGTWKLTYDVTGVGRLFDLEQDPGEVRNMYDDPVHAPIVREMHEELLRWILRTHDPLCLPRTSDRYYRKRAPHNYQSYT
jgi:arylsulfatase A-like enzyme